MFLFHPRRRCIRELVYEEPDDNISKQIYKNVLLFVVYQYSIHEHNYLTK